MKLSDIVALIRTIIKTAPFRACERGLLSANESEPIIASTEKAREELENILQYLRLKQGYFAVEELLPVLEKTGRSRSWLHQEVNKLLIEGRIYYDETRLRYDIMI